MPRVEVGVLSRSGLGPRGLGPDAKPAKRLAALAFVCLLQALESVAEPPAYQHGISLLHELKYPPDFEHFEYANPNAPKGGELKLAATAYIQNFAGVPGTGVPGAQGLGRTVDRLLIRSGDELSGLYGQFADGIALSADRRTVFIRLHAKARWHDGVPVTNFDVIGYDVYRDATVAREAIRKGLFDIYFETDIRHWMSSYDIPAAEAGSLIMETRSLQKFIGLASAIVLNLDQERFRDVRVREALTLALDFEWQNRAFQYGSQSRALSYFANSSFAASGLPTQAELALLAPYRDRLPERVFTEAFRLPISNGSGVHRPALERARDLLAEAGWTIRSGRLVNAAGRPFELELTTQDPSQRRILLPYIESLNMLGIDARLRLLDNVTWVNYRRERNFDAFVRGHDFLNPPLGELQSYFGSGTADLELGGNMAGLRDPIVDALIEKAEQVGGTLDQAMAACRALDRVLLWGFYHIPLSIPDKERFVRWDKFARPEHEAVAKYEYLVGSSVRILDSWWIDPDKTSMPSRPR